MFAAGDKVVYPLHGGAIVKEVERREQGGAQVDYYILQMLFESMTVALPVTSAEKLGLRPIGNEGSLAIIKGVLGEIPDVQAVKSISWNRRFQLYMDKIKSGSVVEVARIFKILTILEKNKKISVGERRLLHNTKQILQSEIMLIRNVDAVTAAAWLDECCG
ncbi:CarD family transcriptional regulator [Phascolarctobacterium sp.]|uniref:CarD family transcriptional regulator n=1 Tax=Phascolarctobacterium sp. TaxID=2049039 RepID=UPI003869CE0F